MLPARLAAYNALRRLIKPYWVMLLLLLLLLSLSFFDTFRMDGGFGFRDWATIILRLWLAGARFSLIFY